MNIFYVHSNPVIAAHHLPNPLIRKMPIESAQMIANVIDLPKVDGSRYSKVFSAHPCSVWVRENKSNLAWLVHHWETLNYIFTRLYSKPHGTSAALRVAKDYVNNVDHRHHTNPALAMPGSFQTDDPVLSYRNYLKSKPYINDYRRRFRPKWTLLNS